MWSMQAALDQVDDVAVDARAQHVRAHHEDARRAALRAPRDAGRDFGQLRMRERRRGSSSASQWSSCRSCARSASGLTSSRARSKSSYLLVMARLDARKQLYAEQFLVAQIIRA